MGVHVTFRDGGLVVGIGWLVSNKRYVDVIPFGGDLSIGEIQLPSLCAFATLLRCQAIFLEA